jgi:hypothetical protein
MCWLSCTHSFADQYYLTFDIHRTAANGVFVGKYLYSYGFFTYYGKNLFSLHILRLIVGCWTRICVDQ